MRYKEITKSIAVPSNTGHDGFLRTVAEIIKMPRVQSITIDASGKVSYTRYSDEGEEELNVDFSDLNPYYIIRNNEVEEMAYPSSASAATVVSFMLDRTTAKNLEPIAFVTGSGSSLGAWYLDSTGFSLLSRNRLFGYPLYTDRHMPDAALVLCAGYGSNESLSKTRYCVKVAIPAPKALSMDLEII